MFYVVLYTQRGDMVKKIDLRKFLVPIKEYSANREGIGGYSLTEDFVKIDSVENLTAKSYEKRRKSATDFAIDNGAKTNKEYLTVSGRPSSVFWTADCYIDPYTDENNVTVVDYDGSLGFANTQSKLVCVSAHVNLDINAIESAGFNYDDIFKIETKKYGLNKVHYIQIGEYPKNNVNEQDQIRFEKLYNSGNLKDGIKATGRYYTTNGQRLFNGDYLSRQIPEFEIDGQKYVRVVALNGSIKSLYNDDSHVAKTGEIRWKKVEPLTFEITNWNKLSKKLNPTGKVFKAEKILDLRTEEGILAGMPFYPDGSEKNGSDWKNSLLRCFLNSLDSKDILNENSTMIQKWNFKNGGFLNQAFDLSREPIKEYAILEFETEICDYAFAGCVGLEKIIIHSGVTKFGKHCFDGCHFKFAYTDKKTKNIVLSQQLPQDVEEFENHINLEILNSAFDDFNYGIILNKEDLSKMLSLANILKKHKFSLPCIFAEVLIKNENAVEFFNNFDFRFLKTEIPNLKEMLQNQPDEEKLNFYAFATVLGCFSNKKFKNKDGIETDVLLAQKASPVLAQILKSGLLSVGEFNELFDTLHYNESPNQDFLKFIGNQDGKGKFKNLELVLNLNKIYPYMFVKAMTKFDKVMLNRKSFDKDGKPCTISWEQALLNLYTKERYPSVEPKDIDLANTFSDYSIEFKVLKEAIEIRDRARAKNVPAHILGKPLKEESILDNIERIKKQTEQVLTENKELIDDLIAKKFTFEMLDKNSPINFIAGLSASCCATLMSVYYGKQLSIDGIEKFDVQNLIVNDSKGKMIGKGIMYVNKADGYIVINDFEINEKYKKHENKRVNNFGTGYYNVKPDSPEEKDRDLIFNAFMRGIKAFVQEYDKQNPDNPIKQVNVGWGFNRLKRQCKMFKKETKNLKVPYEYGFRDAEKDQRILYKREEEKNEEVIGK